jgi:hypothetical protein
MNMNKLPTSDEEVRSLLFVALMAATAAAFRVIYGKGDLYWRTLVGAMGVAMVASCMVYGMAIQYMGPLGGYAANSIGIAVGLFTDDVLRRSRQIIKSKFPGVPADRDDA